MRSSGNCVRGFLACCLFVAHLAPLGAAEMIIVDPKTGKQQKVDPRGGMLTDQGFVRPPLKFEPVGCAGTSSYDPLFDQLEVRDKLVARRFEELDRTLDRLVTRFRPSCSDRPIALVMAALDDDAPALTPLFDEWVATRPRSAWALAARGVHRIGLAMAARGGAYIAQTPPKRLWAMKRIASEAHADFDAAIVLDEYFGHARGMRLHAVKLESGDTAVLELYQRDRQLMPTSFALHAAALDAFHIVWGGTPKLLLAMASWATERSDRNPDLATLPAHAQCNIAFGFISMGKHQLALDYVAKVRGSKLSWSPMCDGTEASAYKRLERLEEHVAAHARFRKALGAANGTTSAANSLRRLRRYGEAIELYELAIRFDANEPRAHCGLADSWRWYGHPAAAQEAARAGIALSPDHEYCQGALRRADAAVARMAARRENPP